MERTINKSLVISGATRGIGREIALRFARGGFAVAFCARDEGAVAALARDLDDAGAEKSVGVVCDVRDKAALRAFADRVERDVGAVDVLVNNAGVFVPGQTIGEDDGVFEQLFETNVASAYHLTRFLLPQLRRRPGAHIFNVCSVASIRPYPTGGSYSVSKFALLGLSKAQREELKSERIKVTSLLPGATWTDSWSGSGVAEERLMKAKDIATVVWDVFHLSENTVVEEMVIRPMLGDLD